MKQIFNRLPSFLLTLLLAISLLPCQAEAAGASFSGSGTLRAGDTVKVTFSVSGSSILGIDATLEYDSSSLEMTGSSQLIGGSWKMQTSGSKFLLYDTEQTSPINGSASVFSVTFRVKSDVSAGSKVSASVTGITVSDGTSDISLGSASWSATIAAPLSGNANLSSLSCSNATLSPSFSSGTTEYSTTVPFDVSSLSLSIRVADSGADYSVSGNDLAVGSNTITIKVTAANGATKRYYIYATRQQDPNYVASTDATLSELHISNGSLSPAFSPEITDYVVYLPYETETVSLTGVANDSKALSVTEANATLVEGENVVSIRCTAEDGITIQEYTVRVIRMPAYAGVLPQIIAPDAEPVEEEEPPTMWQTLWAALCLPVTLPYINRWLPVWALAAIALGVVLVVLVLLFYALGRSGGRKRALRQAMAVPAQEEPPLLTRLASSLEETPETEHQEPAWQTESQEQPPQGDGQEEAPAAESQQEPPQTEEENEPAKEVFAPAPDAASAEPAAEQGAEETPAPAAENSPQKDPVEEIMAELSAEQEGQTAGEEGKKPQTPALSAEEKALEKLSLDELLDDIRDM